MNQDTFEQTYAKRYGMRAEAIKEARNPNGGYFNHSLNLAYQGYLLADSRVEITPAMIEAGAQRLVAWEEGSEWPDSWNRMTVAAARNEAERVIRSVLDAGQYQFVFTGVRCE